MTPDEMRAAIESQIRAWQTGDAQLLAAGFTPDGEIVVPGKRIRGRAALIETMQRLVSQHRDVRVALHRIVYGTDCAAVDYHWEDTKIETGKRYLADDTVWVDFSGGSITRWREYWDTQTPNSKDPW